MKYSWLPQLLAEIAEVAGVEAALKIAEHKGGQRVSIPPYPAKSHWLWQVAGEEAATKICEHFRVLGPDGQAHGARNFRVVIPLGPAAGSSKAVRRQFYEALNGGKSVREASALAGLHERSGWYAKARLAKKAALVADGSTLFDFGLETSSIRPLKARRG